MSTDTSAPRADLFRMVDLSAGEVTFRKAEEEGASDGRIGTLVGYAALFNTDTVIDSWEGRFVERIAPKAFARTLEQRGDKVKVLFNHGFDPSIGDKPLGKPEVMREAGFLYRGIANRSFERKFQLADYVRVVDARLENGLLHVDLRREIPEAMKPRKIEIRSGEGSHLIEGESTKAAA